MLKLKNYDLWTVDVHRVAVLKSAFCRHDSVDQEQLLDTTWSPQQHCTHQRNTKKFNL